MQNKGQLQTLSQRPYSYPSLSTTRPASLLQFHLAYLDSKDQVPAPLPGDGNLPRRAAQLLHAAVSVRVLVVVDVDVVVVVVVLVIDVVVLATLGCRRRRHFSYSGLCSSDKHGNNSKY